MRRRLVLPGLVGLMALVTVCATRTYAQNQKPPAGRPAGPEIPGTASESPAAGSGPALWVNILPFGMKVYGLWRDIRDTNTIYTGTHRGLFRTTTGGRYWAPLAIPKENVEVNWLTFSQSVVTPEVMYTGAALAGREAVVGKTENGGLNWNRVGGGIIRGMRASVVADPKNPGVVYAVAEDRLFKSLNAGATWGEITPQGVSGSVLGLAIDPANPAHLLLTSYKYPVAALPRESADGGLNWTEKTYRARIHPFGPGQGTRDAEWWTFVRFHPANSKVLVGLAGADGWPPASLVISSDGGTTWADISIVDSGRRAEVLCREFSPLSDQVIYACTDTGLYVTEDSGRTWRKLLPDRTVDVAFVSPQTLYAATGRGILKSSNRGKDWYQSSFGIPTHSSVAELGAMGVDPFTAFDNGSATTVSRLAFVAASGRIYVGGHGGYWTSEDSGLHWDWHAIGVRGNVRQIVATQDRQLYLNVVEQGGSRSSVLKIDSGGAIAALRPGKSPQLIAMSPVDPRILYMTAREPMYPTLHPPLLLVSEDGGFSWRGVDLRRSLRPELQPYDILGLPIVTAAPSAPRTAYVTVDAFDRRRLTHETGLLVTTDAGMTWRDAFPSLLAAVRKLQSAGDPGPITAIGVPAHEAEVVYAAIAKRVFRSRDAGKTWVPLASSPLPDDIADIAVDVSSPQIIYLASRSGVWQGTDSGGTWLLAARGLLGGSINKVLASTKFVLAQGRDGIYRLSDDHLSWLVGGWERAEMGSR